MPDSIFVEGGVIIPPEAMEMRAVRASGPGGQNVNKVASKVELRIDLDKIQGLSPDARERLLRFAARRLDSSGRLLVTSQRTRDQSRNLEDARRKVHDWMALALRPPRKRISTKPGPATRERRLHEKRIRSLRKSNRRPARSDGED